jgi:hypothetical protein
MKKSQKVPNLNQDFYYRCNLCNTKFTASEFVKHKSTCAPKLPNNKFSWAIKRDSPINKTDVEKEKSTTIKKGYYVCPVCNRAVLHHQFNDHYKKFHPLMKVPSLTDVEFYRKEYVNRKKKKYGSPYANAKYGPGSNYTIEDEKKLNIAKGRAAFYPKKK